MDEPVIRILNTELPDLIILSEYQAADLLEFMEDHSIDLTPSCKN